MRWRVTAAAIGLALSAGTASAQIGVLAGAVFRDSLSHPLPGAEIWIPQLSQRTQSNAFGDYRIDKLPPGRYLVIARKAGLTPVQDSVSVVEGREATLDFVLLPGVQVMLGRAGALPPVVAGDTVSRYFTPALQGFEARRKAGLGHFIVEQELRKADDQKLSDVLVEHFTTIRVVSVLVPPRTLRFLTLTSTRQRASFTDRECYVAVYLDGIRLGGGTSAVDIGQLESRAAELAGVEFYAAGAKIPDPFNAPSNSCGVVLLWARER